jgi:small subunit ribosomal protein S35
MAFAIKRLKVYRLVSTASIYTRSSFSIRTNQATWGLRLEDAVTRRHFSVSSINRDESDEESEAAQAARNEQLIEALTEEAKEKFASLTSDQRAEQEAALSELVGSIKSGDYDRRLQAIMAKNARELNERFPPEPQRATSTFAPSGLLAMGEEDPHGSGDDPEFAGDDITSIAHAELDDHREMREYARLAAWELPLLTSELLEGTIKPATDIW